jgi:hypothetical protein
MPNVVVDSQAIRRTNQCLGLHRPSAPVGITVGVISSIKREAPSNQRQGEFARDAEIKGFV